MKRALCRAADQRVSQRRTFRVQNGRSVCQNGAAQAGLDRGRSPDRQGRATAGGFVDIIHRESNVTGDLQTARIGGETKPDKIKTALLTAL